MKNLIPFVLGLLITTSVILVAAPPNLSEVQFQHYVQKHLWLARQFAAPQGIPVSICLAQAMHESRAGQSILAVEANNHFGIKAQSEKYWKGEKYFIEDDDFDATGNLKKSAFRKYKSVAESFKDYVDYISSNPRYAAAFKIPKSDYKAWANALHKAGYATDSTYSKRIIEKIEKYQLYKYDEYLVPASASPVTPTPNTAATQPIKNVKQAVQVVERPKQPTMEQLANKKMAVPPPACPLPPQRMEPKKAKPIFLPILLKTE